MNVRRLSSVQSARLVLLIESEFASRRESDDTFARFASAKLGFPVEGSSVQKRRAELGIPCANALKAEEKAHTVEVRLEAIEARLAIIERKLSHETPH